MVDKSYRNYVVPACQGMPRKPYKSSSKNPAWRLQDEIVPGLSANRKLPGLDGGTSSVKSAGVDLSKVVGFRSAITACSDNCRFSSLTSLRKCEAAERCSCSHRFWTVRWNQSAQVSSSSSNSKKSRCWPPCWAHTRSSLISHSVLE
jgi:hypothetical protein